MKCERWEYRLANGETGADIDHHLADCDGCRALAVELRENAVALASMRDEKVPEEVMPGRKVGRPRWPWVAALAAAAMLVAMLWPHSEAPVAPAKPVVQVLAQPAIPLPPPEPAKPKPVVNRPAPRPKPKPAQPLLVKMLTDDPEVVIYWLIDGDEGERAI